ncbi:MAG: DnaA/Hda family protein, partial [Sideroxydans sp.]
MTQMLLGIAPEWIPSFENFVVGRNLELISLLQQALSSTQDERCIYLWGETGSGKSHLLHAAAARARAAGIDV